MSVTNPKLGAINNFIDMLQARQGQHLDKNWPGAPSLTEIISRLVIKGQLSYFEAIPKETILKVVHVASVLQRSPFRYPEGKTWLISVVRNGLQSNNNKTLIEPFASGGILSFTTAFENLAKEIIMIELDPDVSAVWEVIINGDYNWLANKIYSFDLTPENANTILQKECKSLNEQAFSTIMKNRIFHGGIGTKGVGLIKNGEHETRILSPQYPNTLGERIVAIGYAKSKFRTPDPYPN